VDQGTVVKDIYYVRDAQGNVIAVYEKDATSFAWMEQHLYGASRLGIWRPSAS
jgi:hypothetical protein